MPSTFGIRNAKNAKTKGRPLGDDMISGDLPRRTPAIRRQEKIALYRAVQTLGEPMRDVVYLWLTGEFTFAEIGRVLGKSENWARTTFYRAKQKIFEEMG
jgi:RNA polymerase sigma-70 factor (ECF subfamily)